MKKYLYLLGVFAMLLAACAPATTPAEMTQIDTGVDPETWVLVRAGEFLYGQHNHQTNLDYDFEIIFIDDGSTDASANVLRQLAAANRQVSYILLSRNFGKDSALSAGLSKAHGDAVITMGADLQHPPTLIPAFLEHWENGNEVVYAYRESKNEHASRMNKVSW